MFYMTSLTYVRHIQHVLLMGYVVRDTLREGHM